MPILALQELRLLYVVDVDSIISQHELTLEALTISIEINMRYIATENTSVNVRYKIV